MRILALVTGDPFGPRTFSGSVRHLLLAMRQRGSLAAAENVELPKIYRRIERLKYQILTRRIEAAKVLCDWSGRAIAARSARANVKLMKRSVMNGGADAVLMYGTNFFPSDATEKLKLPVGAAMDATFAQIAQSRESWFADLTPGEIDECVERQRKIFNKCEYLFPRTAWCARSLASDYGIRREKLVITGAGSNLEHAPGERSGYDMKTILFVGRDWERKHGPAVVEAFRIAKKKAKLSKLTKEALQLVIIGPRVSGVREEGIEWVGPLDGDDRSELAHWYHRASLLLCPSRFEPFGIVILEAMASGCPVIALDRGAAREIIVHNVTGSLVERADPELLSNEILAWLTDERRCAEAGRAAQRRAAENYSWQIAASKIESAFGGSPEPVSEESLQIVELEPIPKSLRSPNLIIHPHRLRYNSSE
ncbi:MAG: glycosyltransferase family 4 protein [Planctomycetota bacterium]